MENKSEIDALLRLLDDPDEQIYHQIEKRLLSYGAEVIEFLEKRLGTFFRFSVARTN